MGLRLLGCCRRGRIRSRRRSYCVLHGTRREGRSVQSGSCTLVHLTALRLAYGPPSSWDAAKGLTPIAGPSCLCTSSRPKARTAHCAIARLAYGPPSGWDGWGAAAVQRPGLTGQVWYGSGVAGWRMYAGGPEVRGPRCAFVWLGWFVVWEFSCSLMSFSRLTARMSLWRRTRRWLRPGSRSR